MCSSWLKGLKNTCDTHSQSYSFQIKKKTRTKNKQGKESSAHRSNGMNLVYFWIVFFSSFFAHSQWMALKQCCADIFYLFNEFPSLCLEWCGMFDLVCWTHLFFFPASLCFTSTLCLCVCCLLFASSPIFQAL